MCVACSSAKQMKQDYPRCAAAVCYCCFRGAWFLTFWIVPVWTVLVARGFDGLWKHFCGARRVNYSEIDNMEFRMGNEEAHRDTEASITEKRTSTSISNTIQIHGVDLAALLSQENASGSAVVVCGPELPSQAVVEHCHEIGLSVFQIE